MNDIITQTTHWFELAHGDARASKITVQLGVHFEEVSEMMDALTTKDKTAHDLLRKAQKAVSNLADHLKRNSNTTFVYPENHDLLLDSLCDQAVTLTGVAYDYGYKFPQALREVNRSNFSKFVNGAPVFDENGKIKKGPDYTPPNLVSYVN